MLKAYSLKYSFLLLHRQYGIGQKVGIALCQWGPSHDTCIIGLTGKPEAVKKKKKKKGDNVKNLDASKNATVTTKSLSVTIVAPKSVIDQIEANDISADIDMSSINVTGSTEVPVTITVNSASGKAWAYGSYKVNINVRKT